MFDAVDAITRKFRNFHRRLNDARINRRGDRDRDAAPPAQLPAALRAFAYHGRYLGAFPNVEAFAHACIDPLRPETWAAHVDLTQVGIDLHLSGRYWTVDDDGVTHAFALAQPEHVNVDHDAAQPWRARGLSSPHPSPRPSHRPPPHSAPPAARHEPARAHALLRASGLEEREIAACLNDYVGRYVVLADHAWFHLRAAGMPSWLLGHADLGAMVEDWCVSGVLTTLPDPEGGVHVFAHRDPLASDE